jgi:uncharacterized protein YsxB (DUF464 family)
MIKAELVLEQGLLKSCRIQGHAGNGPKGGDIVCAAVSVLARTAFKVLSERKDLRILGGTPERGEFWLEIASLGTETKEFLAGVGIFLEEGLLSVSKEYPDFCIVSIEESR